MTDIKFIDGPPPARTTPGNGAERGRAAAIRASLRANPGVWAEVAREPKDNSNAAYQIAMTLKAGRPGVGIEAVTRADGSTAVVYARFVA